MLNDIIMIFVRVIPIAVHQDLDSVTNGAYLSWTSYGGIWGVQTRQYKIDWPPNSVIY